MVTKIIALILGIIILAGGLYYLKSSDPNDAESKKIYGIVSAAGAIIALVAALLLFLQ